MAVLVEILVVHISFQFHFLGIAGAGAVIFDHQNKEVHSLFLSSSLFRSVVSLNIVEIIWQTTMLNIVL